MKKVVLSGLLIGILGLSFTACKDAPKSNTTEEPTTMEEKTVLEEGTEAVKSQNGVPTFSDSDVQSYVDAYESYMVDYQKAVKNKDIEALTILATKGQNLGNKAQEISGKVSGADAERLSEYMTKKATEIQELSKKMME